MSNPDDVFCTNVQRPVDVAHPVPPVPCFEEHRRLCNAVLDGRVDVLRSLLVDDELDVNARSKTGNTAGHEAAIEGRVEEMSTLICHGLDIDAVNDEGNTALHLASRHGRVKVARRLAEAFPNEELMNHRGFTALDEAMQAGRAQCGSCIRGFTDFGKAQMLEEHCHIERERLEKVRRNKEILYGRDLDVQPREDDFRSMRACAITPNDRALICASLQASAVTLRCIAAGLQTVEKALARRAQRRKHARRRKKVVGGHK
ncbi:unnamed protein product [Ectocarpus fasciculatus]